jgi:PAS domain S-box-containing protein
MFSNQSKLGQSIIENEELKNLRIMLISAIVSYPIWGLLSRYLEPMAYDPYWQRLVCSFLALAALVLTFTWKNSCNHLPWFYRITWMYSYHLLYLYWKNPDTAYYVICNLIQFPYLVLCFPSKKDAQIFTYTKFVAITLFAFLVPYTKINPWFFVLSMVTIGHYLLTVIAKHFNVIETLNKARFEFDQALSNMLEGVAIIDLNGILISYNNSAANLLGFRSSSHVGKSYLDTCLHDSSPIKEVLALKQPIKSVVISIEVNGERSWLQLNIQPLVGSEHILISFADITELKKSQEMKEMEQAQLAMASKLSSLFKVAGGVAHEINNPLSVVITRLQSIEKKTVANEWDKEAINVSLKKTIENAFRIAKVVNTLLNLARSADEKPFESAKLVPIIEETLRLCQENFRRNEIELIIDEIPDVSISCRPMQISHVLLNLLTNSFEAVQNQEYKWARLSFARVENKIAIAVIDSGRKIESNVESRMMEPFFTTKEIGKGAGLGLSVSKAIIEEHAGKLYVDQEAFNTCIVVELLVELA